MNESDAESDGDFDYDEQPWFTTLCNIMIKWAIAEKIGYISNSDMGDIYTRQLQKYITQTEPELVVQIGKHMGAYDYAMNLWQDVYREQYVDEDGEPLPSMYAPKAQLENISQPTKAEWDRFTPTSNPTLK